MRYSFPNAIIMNIKNHKDPVYFIGHVLRTFVWKLTQNPDYYYNTKHYNKSKSKHTHHETMR